MAVTYKNEIDGPPVIGVDLTPSAAAGVPLPASRWYQSQWTTDQTLFLNAAARSAANFYTDGTFLANVRKFSVGLPRKQWDSFRPSQRHIYFRVGSGTSQTMSTWQWSVVTDIQINHMPKADAGAPQTIALTAGAVATDIVLDGSASSDPDAGSQLNYVWTLKSPPASCFDPSFLSSLRARLAAGGKKVTPFPSGTAIPLSCEGAYTFLFEVSDDDPPSFRRNTIGKATTEAKVTLGSCLNRICLDHPTSASPARQLRPTVDVEIDWRMDSALRQQLQVLYAANHRLTLSILDSTGTEAWKDIQMPVPVSGMFVWDGTQTDASPAPPGTYDVKVALEDHLGAPVSIPGFTTQAVEAAAVQLEEFQARIDRRNSTTFVSLGTPAAVAYEIVAPQELDEVMFTVTPAGGGTPPAIATNSPGGYEIWTPPAPGSYVAKLSVKRQGITVAESEGHELFVLEDPVAIAPARLFPVGETTYDQTTDAFAPAATRTLALGPGDGYPLGVTVNISALVRYPASAAGVGTPVSAIQAKYPLVLIVHGNHAPGVGSYTGFEYLARHLASLGMIACSIDEDVLNGPPPLPGSINYRAQVLNSHISRWIAKAGMDPRFMGKVELTRVGLVGHSRGGEAVVEAARIGAPAGATIAGIVSIAPTDALADTASGQPYLVIYGSVDGDVINAHGFRLYDRASRPKAQVFVYGATHNDFVNHPDWHTERTEPAPSRILTAADVQLTTKAFTAALMRWALLGRAEDAHFFDPQVTPVSVAARGITTVKSLEAPGTKPIDRFELMPHAIATTDGGLVVRADPLGSLAPLVEQALTFVEAPGLTYVTDHFQQLTWGALVGWMTPGTYVIELGGMDVSAYRVLTFRVAQALTAGSPPADARNPAGVAKNFLVQLGDASRTAAVDLGGFAQMVPYPYVRNDQPTAYSSITAAYAVGATKSAFTSVRIPLWAFKAVRPKLDMKALTELRFSFVGVGFVVLDDIEFSP